MVVWDGRVVRLPPIPIDGVRSRRLSKIEMICVIPTVQPYLTSDIFNVERWRALVAMHLWTAAHTRAHNLTNSDQ
jgi:hypothetical protein